MSTPLSAHELATLLGADGVVVLGVDGPDLAVHDVWPANPAVAPMLRIPIGFGVTGLVARNAEPVRLRDDSPRNPIHRQLLGLRPEETIARLCLPALGVQGTVAGVVAFHRSPSHPFTRHELELAAPHVALVGLTLHAEQLWRQAHHHRSERDRLIEAAISAQEAERRRIAHDLHDGVTTVLASMSFQLSAVALSVSSLSAAGRARDRERLAERAKAEVSSARVLADLAYEQTRTAISGLHSLVLGDLGLSAALESLATMATGDHAPTLDLLVDPDESFRDVPDHAAAALFRIAQEAIGNAVKHAQADRIVLSLRRVGDAVVLGCTDDGVGFDPAERRTQRGDDHAQHFGLSSIAERCALVEAALRVESMPGRGTTLLVELPIQGRAVRP